jgi:prepilin-type N-terminal cleavage/methylation domain-containing protein
MRGVTLIEMMVVVMVIALVVSISTPSVAAGIDAVRLATACSSVASFLNAAATRAERRQRPVELIVSAPDNSLRFVSTDAGSYRELKLPEGIVLEGVLGAAGEDPESARRWLFVPGGTVPGIGIRLANRHGGHRIVRLDPMTGFPRVERVEKK